jgi:hypothetical protein
MIDKKPSYPKSPAEDIDFGINWAPLLKAGETISTSVWTVPTDMSVSRQQIVGAITSCYLSGGTIDTKVKVFNVITTSLNATYERFFELELEHIQV